MMPSLDPSCKTTSFLSWLKLTQVISPSRDTLFCEICHQSLMDKTSMVEHMQSHGPGQYTKSIDTKFKTLTSYIT